MYLTSKRTNIVANPFQGHPLVFESKITLDPGPVTGEKPERGKTIADIDPDFGALGGYVLGLAFQVVW